MPDLIFEKRNHIAYLTLNRPERRNTYSCEMIVLLAQAWREARGGARWTPGSPGAWGAELNNLLLKAGGLEIGGLNPRLKEKAAESRWFGPRAERPSGGLKPPYGNQVAAAGTWA